MRSIALPFLAALAAIAIALDATYDLRWRPKEGDVARYAMSFETTIMDEPLVFSSDLVITVKKVEANGDYTVETAMKNGRTKIGDETEAVEDPPVEVETYSAKGDRISAKGAEEDDPFTAILEQASDALDPRRPVKVGEKWVAQINADDKRKTPPARVEYEAAVVEKVGEHESVKIAMRLRQTEGAKPTRVEGAVWVATKDGSLVRIEAEVIDLRFDAEFTAPKATVRLVRQ